MDTEPFTLDSLAANSELFISIIPAAKVELEISQGISAGYKTVNNTIGVTKAVVPSVKGLIGKDVEDYRTKTLGGKDGFMFEGRDFDGGLGNRWWEAKSGQYWGMILSDQKKLQKFYSDMGSRLNIATKNNASYELHSNTPIPDVVKTWLEKKGIKYFEWLD